MLRPSEKFKFNFDWDSKDDTSRDLNPLYNNLHGEAGAWRAMCANRANLVNLQSHGNQT